MAQPSEMRATKALRWTLAVLVTVAVGALTLAWAHRLSADARAHNADRFDDRATSVAEQVRRSVEVDTGVLTNVAALQGSLGPLDEANFLALTRSGILQGHPELRGVSFLTAVRGDQLDAFVASRRAAGDTAFTPRVQAPADQYAIVTYSGPQPSTSKGLDLYGGAERRDAFDRSRDSGLPAVSAGFTLVADQSVPADQRQLSVAVYVPVYAGGAVPPTVDARRAALVGWIASAFRGQDMLSAIAPGDDNAGVVLFDGTVDPAHRLGLTPLAAKPNPDAVVSRAIDVGGRVWVAQVVAPRGALSGNTEPSIVLLIAGGIAAIALGLLVLTQLGKADELRHEVAEAIKRARIAEGRFQAAFDESALPGALCDTEGAFIYVNDAMCAVLGRSRDQLLGVTFRSLSHRDDVHIGPPQVDRLIAGQERTIQVEKRYHRGDGSIVRLRLTTAPLRDEDLRIIGLVCQAEDITEAREAEEALRSAEAVQRASLGALEQGVALSTLDGTVLLLNDAGRHVLQMTAEELEHKFKSGQWESYREDGTLLPVAERPLGITMTTGRAVTGSIVAWKTGEGKLVTLRVTTRPLFDDNGELRGVVTAFADVTAERRRGKALAEAQQALQTSRARYAALVERSSDITCVLDEAGRLTYASPAAERLLGYQHGSMTGTPFSALLHEDDRPLVIDAFTDLLADPHGTRSIEARIADTHGSWHNIEIVGTNMLDDPAVGGIVANVRDVTERTEAANRLAWQAFHDTLTGLPNRALLRDRLAHALSRAGRDGATTALLFLDLDRFKLVNDTMGHEAGDSLLIEVAGRLSRAVREGDTVARLGGDEFVVLAEGINDPAEAAAIATRIHAELAEPITLAQGVVTVAASIGIAFDSDRRPDSLLRDADTALYRAKDNGRSRTEVFDDSLRMEAMRRLTTEQLLRTALEGDGLVVHYQPVIDLVTGEVVSAEALLRMRGADGQLRSPAEFIPVAEESGLIVPIGAGVLDDACANLAKWRRELGDDAPQTVSVNVAARQLSSPGFAEMVEHAIVRHGLEPHDLIIEYTESTILAADRSTLKAVEQLHDQGVVFAVDDFGTGYSSLAYLKRFPVDVLKLDRSFVGGLGADQNDTEIVRAVLSLGRALGLLTVAEGIETPEQLEALRELGADCGQGFLLAAPAPAEELAGAIARLRSSVSA